MTARRPLTVTLALLALAVVWFAVIDRPPARRPPRTASSAPTARLVGPPTARQILARADVLGLAPGQRARLAALADAWDRDSAPLDAALKAASEEFARFAREAQQSGRTRLHDVRARTEDVQSLSARVRERRVRHADEALAILTDAQRTQLSDLRQITGGTR